MTEREEGRCVLRGHQRSVALLRLLRLLLPLPTAAAGCAEETIAEETPYRFHYKIRWRRLIIQRRRRVMARSIMAVNNNNNNNNNDRARSLPQR